ncbi:uncharacterized protein I303_104658 [Kwoniella dejecticola CBS 10117]|uniref:Uncharacterized protein n=1 Tax=Kwoniella dejecticola CBS 10117 TaxID=1296121 RepID=A0A1A6A4Q2_9TREE|nr:uncharacterized protein I303_04362 [Kwoniella dejecticola CBS 10117]OBR85035.1 hypothetical protein I303_04362 [Kwoniella dejecticola CBS 10117]
MPKHYLIVPHGIWGHLRPAISFIPNLLRHSPDALVTLMIPIVHSIPAAQELRRYGLDEEQENIKVIHYGSKEKKEIKQVAKTGLVEMMTLIEDIISTITENYPKLLNSQPIFDTYLNKEVQPHSTAPDVAIIEVSTTQWTIPICEKYNEEYKKNTRLAVWCPTGGNHAAWALCNLYQGQKYQDRISKIFAATSEDEKQRIYNEVIGENEEIVHAPNSAPIRVFEAQPNQPDNFLNIIGPCLPIIPRVTLVHAWPAFIGQEYKKTAADVGINVLQIGPQLPRPTDRDSALEDGLLKDFLDKALEEKGKNSVIYIRRVSTPSMILTASILERYRIAVAVSFGTLLFPANIEQISIMIDVLIAQDKRFVLARGIASPEIQDLIAQKVDQSGGRGIHVDWAPQFAVLQHEATGWFLTHGGSNSTMEAMRTRTPMLFWPADVDQVWIANQFSRILSAGYEFYQIRNGPSIGRTTYTGVKVEGTREAMQKEFEDVFGALDGQLGKKLRKGVEELGEKMDNDKYTEEDWSRLLEL